MPYQPEDDSVLWLRKRAPWDDRVVNGGEPDYLDGVMNVYPQADGSTVYEYQVGSTLVYAGGSDEDEVSLQANRLMPSIWADRAAARAVAEQGSRLSHPELWSAHDQAGTSAWVLAVQQMDIDLPGSAVDYMIGSNHHFFARAEDRGLPRPRDYIWVRRYEGRFFIVPG